MKFTTGYVSVKDLRTSFSELHHFLHRLSLSLDGKVNVNDLNALLDNMGIKISDKELKALTKNLLADGEQVVRYHSYMLGEIIRTIASGPRERGLRNNNLP